MTLNTKFGTNSPTEGFWANGWNITKIYFYFYFFSGLRTSNTRGWIFTCNSSKDVKSRKGVPFGDLNDVPIKFWCKTPKTYGTSFRPTKGTSLRDFMSFELSRVKIHPRVWPVREPEKKYINKNNILLYFIHLPRSPQWVDLYEIWYRRSSRGHNQLCWVCCWSVQGCRFCGGWNLPIPITVWTVVQTVLTAIFTSNGNKHVYAEMS